MSNRMKLGLALVAGLVLAGSAAWAVETVTVTNAAAMNGTTFGMQVNLDGSGTNAFVVSQHPNDETHFLFRFWINPHDINLTPNTALRIGAVGDANGAVGQHVILFLRHDASVVPAQYQLNFWYRDKAAGASYKFGGATYFTTVTTPCSREYEVEWTADTDTGASPNGTLVVRRLANAGTCTPTGLLTRTKNNLDTDGYQVDNARFGTLNGQGSNNTGSHSFYFDEYESYR